MINKEYLTAETTKESDLQFTPQYAVKPLFEFLIPSQIQTIWCPFDDETSEDYENGIGVDPIGGVEAIISHYISRELKVPCAHSPAFKDYTISPKIVNKKASSEYITPTFLPCILIGLNNAPLLTTSERDITIKNLDYLVMPANSLGAIPIFEALKRNIKIFAIKENVTLLNVTNASINATCGINIIDTYDNCLEQIKNAFKKE